MLWRAGAARIILLALIALLVVACDRSPGTTSPRPPAQTGSRAAESAGLVRTEIDEKVVQPLAQAFLKGDKKLLPRLSPRLPSLYRKWIMDAVDRSQEFGIDRLTLEADDSAPKERDARTFEVAGVYRLSGVPADLPFSANIRAEPVGDQDWQISFFGWSHPPAWSVSEPVERTVTDAALVFSPPGIDAAEIVRLVKEARTKIARGLPTVGDKRYVVLVAPTSSDYSDVGGGGAASVVVQQSVQGRSFETSEPVLVVRPDEWEEAGAADRQSLMLHEVTHAILAPHTSPLVPDWVTEGIAVFYSKTRDLSWFEKIRR